MAQVSPAVQTPLPQGSGQAPQSFLQEAQLSPGAQTPFPHSSGQKPQSSEQLLHPSVAPQVPSPHTVESQVSFGSGGPQSRQLSSPLGSAETIAATDDAGAAVRLTARAVLTWGAEAVAALIRAEAAVFGAVEAALTWAAGAITALGGLAGVVR